MLRGGQGEVKKGGGIYDNVAENHWDIVGLCGDSFWVGEYFAADRIWGGVRFFVFAVRKEGQKVFEDAIAFAREHLPGYEVKVGFDDSGGRYVWFIGDGEELEI